MLNFEEKRQRNLMLVRLAQQGDEAAQEAIISENMSLVRSLAARFRDRGVEYEDLVQIGVIGMYRAVQSFDFTYDTAFSTYAVPLITGEIRRYLRDDGMLKVSREVKKQGSELLRISEQIRQQTGRDATVQELCAASGLSAPELMFALDGVMPVRSLSEPVGKDGELLTLEGTLSDHSGQMEHLCEGMALREALRKLGTLERQVIYLRYFKDLTQLQTARVLGLTQVKVSRLEKKIFLFLRAEMNA